ncbi:hypothetical protein DdX_12791 [Ditylenchus destructor]|uniref:F-box domain-containing protein n=1 Tax=Ditylenchus destructor TaxID=166010 RepID=A0AAD4MTZ9_9BILA|nr:hypothetical protein DdX_12791 [Ditylenchus destructor]
MSIPSLPLGLQRGVFAHFNRHELGRISETNRRFNTVIEQHNDTLPYLVYDYLHYKNGVWKWLPNADLGKTDDALEAATLTMSDSQIAQLPTSKYLRFRRTYFERFHFNGRNVMNGFMMPVSNILFHGRVFIHVIFIPLEALKTHNHLWEGHRLSVNIKKFSPSMEFANMVNTCDDLIVKAPGAIQMLPQLLRKCKHVKIVDTTENSMDHLPVTDIINFLFDRLHGNHSDFHHLAFVTHYELQSKHFAAIMGGIGQKFLETRQHPMFLFEVEGSDLNWTEVRNYTLEHPHSDKKLWFNKFDRFFRFTCSTHDLNVP